MGLTPTALPNQRKISLPKPGHDLPSGVPLTFDFSAQASYTVNLSLFQSQGNIGGASSMFIDNSTGSATLVVTLGSGQVIKCKAGYQGWTPILAPNPISLTASGTTPAGSPAQVILVNYYVSPHFWPTS